MKRSDAFPSRYISKDDVAQPVRVQIDTVRFETIKGEHSEEDKPVMYFRNGVKPMVLNLINWTSAEEAFGQESDDWSGKTVELYLDPGVMFGGKRVGGVRLRVPKDAVVMTLEQANAVTFTAKSGTMRIGDLDAEKLNIIINNAKLEHLHEAAQIRLTALENAPEL